MDFNILLKRFGISSENFVNKLNEPIPIQGGFLYDVEQRTDIRNCPHCHHNDAHIIGYYFTNTNCSETDNFKDILRVKRVRFRCKKCGKTFSPKIKGIERYSIISEQTKRFIVSDFTKNFTFAQIAERYGLTKARVIQIFDEEVPFVPRRRMPRVLCIDEIHFEEVLDQKYCCVLYDFEKKEIIDIIRNRQMPYLREYFSNIPFIERNNVEIFISDMYDAYSTVQSNYFPKSIHIIDRFHILTQLTRAVNTLRVRAMNTCVEKGSLFYNFMKTHWQEYLRRYEDISSKTYTYKKTFEAFDYQELVLKSIKLDEDLWSAHLILQNIFHYSWNHTFEEALNFFMHTSETLLKSGSELLKKVGHTYRSWRVEIANAYTRNTKGINYTNAIAECLNNQLKTMIKSAYGFHNFERFRKKAMLVLTYSKTEK